MTRSEDIAEQVLDLHKQLATKVQEMNDAVHKLCGEVAVVKQLDLAVVGQIGDIRERLAMLTTRTMWIAAVVSLGGGIIAAVLTAWSYMASRLNSFFGVRP